MIGIVEHQCVGLSPLKREFIKKGDLKMILFCIIVNKTLNTNTIKIGVKNITNIIM